jgi:hypothetical protein
MEVSVSAPIDASSTGSKLSATKTTTEEKTNKLEKNNDYTSQEQSEIAKLKARDRVVRAHEAAHIAAGAGIVKGGASFSFQRGPDGVQYAIGGEVQIDTSTVAGNPEATLQKAQKIRAAALAPAQPSSTDRAVAANAAQMAIEARAEINQQRKAEKSESEKKSQEASSNQPTPFTPPELRGNFLDFTA